MPVVSKSYDIDSTALGGPDRKARVPDYVVTVIGITAMFMVLVILPETRANIWSPSSAGDSSFLVGP